jgi:plasmid stabilization system protein ParE
MTLEFLPEASIELHEAATYYEGKQPGLGWRFRSEILDLCRIVVQQPLLWRERPGGYRRVNCPVFPYYLAYFIRDDRLIIAAIAHASRHPNYWRERLPSA